MVVKESGRKAWLVIPCHQGPQVLGSGGSELCVLGQLILGMLESCPGTSSLRNMPFHHKYVNTSYRLFFVVFFFFLPAFVQLQVFLSLVVSVVFLPVTCSRFRSCAATQRQWHVLTQPSSPLCLSRNRAAASPPL